MKKTLNTDTITNELHEGSAFFQNKRKLVEKSTPTIPSNHDTTNAVTRKQGNKEVSLFIPFIPDKPQRPKLTKKQTFEFGQTELDFLDQAKYELRESKVTKNDVVLTALELLKKDYQQNKETSFLGNKFTSKQGNKEPSLD